MFVPAAMVDHRALPGSCPGLWLLGLGNVWGTQDICPGECALCVPRLKSGVHSASVECGETVQINGAGPRQNPSVAHCAALGPAGMCDCFYRSSAPQLPQVSVLGMWGV